MGKGKYQTKGQIPWPLILLVVILAVIVVLTVLMLRSCGGEQSGPTEPVQTVTEPSETTEPEPSETTEPEPSETTEPEPSETTEPEPSETTEPEPTETEPEPTETEPEPTETTEPEPTEPEPTETEPEPTEPVYDSRGEEVAAMAVSQIGKPERSAEYPDGFDVGSFIAYCFRQCGFSNVPRDFNSLLTYGTVVTERQNGDVVVFHITPEEGEAYDYIGIVVEGDQFVAVSSSSQMVIKRPLSYFSSYSTVYRRFT